MTTRLEKAKIQLARAEARVQRLDALAKTQQRKDDTRRKVLAGAIALSLMEEESGFRGWFEKELDKRIRTRRDRELFNLALSD